jgi:GTP 3',8-cyclase / cyclic pyranopterin monophosphate synthase
LDNKYFGYYLNISTGTFSSVPISACGIRSFSDHKFPTDEPDETGKKRHGHVEFPQDHFSPLKYWEAEFNERQQGQEEATEEEVTLNASEAFYNNWECNDYVTNKNSVFVHRAVEPELSHVDRDGHASMVNVSRKPVSIRTASAQAEVMIGATAFRLVKQNNIHKGDVLKVAEIAGVMGAKETSRLIPLCHPLVLSQIKVHLSLNEDKHSVDIESHVTTRGQTGVEMEALTAVSVAALTVYDMIKAVTREAQILNVRLTSKTGGTRGDYVSARSSSI